MMEPASKILGTLIVAGWIAGTIAIAAEKPAAGTGSKTEKLGRSWEIADGPFQPNWESLEGEYQCPEWFRDAKFAAVTLLGSEEKPAWKAEADALVIQPVAKWPSDHTVAFKIVFAK
jgi:hypothetical protein